MRTITKTQYETLYLCAELLEQIVNSEDQHGELDRFCSEAELLTNKALNRDTGECAS